MLIGLIGDTHGQTGAVLPALQHARDAGAELVVLMGDVGWWPRRAAMDFFGPVQRALRRLGMAGAGLDGNHDFPGDGTDRNGYLAWTAQAPDLSPGAFVRLDRGARFELDGCSFLTCGGAVSIDKSYRATTGPRATWWSEEAVTDADVDKVRRACGDAGPVDVLLTHDSVELPPGFDPAGDAAFRAAADVQRARMHLVREYARPQLHVHGHFHDARVYCRTLDDGRELRTIGLGADGGSGCLYLQDTGKLRPQGRLR